MFGDFSCWRVLLSDGRRIVMHISPPCVESVFLGQKITQSGRMIRERMMQPKQEPSEKDMDILPTEITDVSDPEECPRRLQGPKTR